MFTLKTNDCCLEANQNPLLIKWKYGGLDPTLESMMHESRKEIDFIRCLGLSSNQSKIPNPVKKWDILSELTK